jgi:hypothetical protein
MRRSALKVLGGLALVMASGSPAQAWTKHKLVYGVPWYVQPAAPVSPLGFIQVLQGVQLAQGLLGGLQSSQGQQLLHLVLGNLLGQQPGTQQPAACKVSQDVVDSLDRVDKALDDIVTKTNALTKGFRDPRFPDVNKPIEVAKPKDQTTSRDGKTLTPPK